MIMVTYFRENLGNGFDCFMMIGWFELGLVFWKSFVMMVTRFRECFMEICGEKGIIEILIVL